MKEEYKELREDVFDEKMLELVDNIEPLWNDIRKAISDFWDKL